MRWMKLLGGLALLACAAGAGPTAKPVIPYNQKSEPGPALSPADAMAKMKLPPGFKVTLVASEPDVDQSHVVHV